METVLTPLVTVRQLPPEEWERLLPLPFARVNGLPDPSLAAILVAESDGEIIGVWAAMTTVMLDGLWIAPSFRKTPARVAVKLLRGMRALLAELGVVRSITLVQTPDVLLLALKAGFTRVPGDLCLLDLTSHQGGA
jgi:hypothetical protein